MPSILPKRSIGTEPRGPDDFELVWDDRPSEPGPDTREIRLYGAEAKALASDRLRLENDLLQQEIEDVRQDRAERRKYSGRIFGLVVAYLVVVGLLVLLAGLDQVPFGLPASVLMVLIGSTAVSMVGLFAIVANYLFPQRPRT